MPSILDSLVGGGAGAIDRNLPSRGRESFLTGQADEILSDPGFQGLENVRAAGIRALLHGRQGERRAAIGRAAANVGQSVRVGVGPDAVDQAIRRGRGLTRLVGATKREFDQQLLRDRIAAVGRGVQRQGQGRRTVAGALGIRDMVLDAQSGAEDIHRSARRGIAGTLLGTAIGASQPSISRGIRGIRANRAGLSEINLGGLPSTRAA